MALHEEGRQEEILIFPQYACICRRAKIDASGLQTSIVTCWSYHSRRQSNKSNKPPWLRYKQHKEEGVGWGGVFVYRGGESQQKNTSQYHNIRNQSFHLCLWTKEIAATYRPAVRWCTPTADLKGLSLIPFLQA